MQSGATRELKKGGQRKKNDRQPPRCAFPAPNTSSDRQQEETRQVHAKSTRLGDIHREKLLHPLDHARLPRH
jgi:hypothetical protein